MPFRICNCFVEYMLENTPRHARSLLNNMLPSGSTNGIKRITWLFGRLLAGGKRLTLIIGQLDDIFVWTRKSSTSPLKLVFVFWLLFPKNWQMSTVIFMKNTSKFLFFNCLNNVSLACTRNITTKWISQTLFIRLNAYNTLRSEVLQYLEVTIDVIPTLIHETAITNNLGVIMFYLQSIVDYSVAPLQRDRHEWGFDRIEGLIGEIPTLE